MKSLLPVIISLLPSQPLNDNAIELDMKITLLKTTLLSLLILLASACSTPPTHLIVVPEIYISPSNLYAAKKARVNVIDMRTSRHIVQILNEGEAATILSAEKRLSDTVQGILEKQWPRQGLLLNDNSINHITVNITKAIISVDQESVNYTTQSEIIIEVTIDNGKQTLTNTFKTRAYSEGALTADIAALELEFNQHLSKVLKQILVSNDIINFL